MSSFSTSDTRTPTKASAALADFSLSSLCSSAKKPIASSSNASFMQASNLSSFHYDKHDKPNTTTTTSSSSTSFLSSNVDLIQAKIEHLERERIDLAMQLHKRDEKDRDRKMQVERLENRLKQSEEERSKATTELLEYKDQAVRMKIEQEELQLEIGKLQKEISSTNRFEAMDVWKKMTTASRELKRVEDELNQSNNERAMFHAENTRLQHEQSVLSELNDALKEEVEKLKKSLEDITDVFSRYEILQQTYDAYLEKTTTELHALQQEVEEVRSHAIDLRIENEDLAQRLSQQEEMNFNTSMVIGEGNDVETVVTELKMKLQESEQKRRQLHNLVQELKGNIRVFVRCRPFLLADGEDAYNQQQSMLLFHEDQTSLTVLPGTASSNVKPHQFTFDHIFPSNSKQEEIYEEVSSLVQSALDGYRVCIFSYGQTGSGKTHTMTGGRMGEARGIIPRAIEELLQQIQSLQSMGWTLEVTSSIVEIYNEDLRDLLPASLQQQPAGKGQKAIENNNHKKEYKIMRHPQSNKVVVSGLNSHNIPTNDVEDGIQTFHQILDLAAMTRTTASTGMNETSSRSHLIVMIDVQGSYSNPNPSAKGANSTITIQGGLRLCDLAGSERLDRTNTLHDATRLKETVNINKSLSCLADVFLALSSKASHVPYRNSKLTMLLQDCLSGEGKSLMFVNVSPTVASTQETICSLRFANQVSQVELGKAQKHIVTTAVVQAPPAPAPVAVAHAAIMPPPAPVAAPANVMSTTPRRSTRAQPTPTAAATVTAPTTTVNDNSFCEESPAAVLRPSTRSSIATSSTTEKAVRFNNVVVEEAANNKPLPVYSFLSSNQPAERIPGTAPKVRMLSGSVARRCSTATTATTTTGAVRLTKADFSIAATVTSKENELNVGPAMSVAPIRASKRESTTIDYSAAPKRTKVTMDDTPSQWNLGSNTGFAPQSSRRTSTWR